MYNHSKTLVITFSGFLVLSIFTVSQYHYVSYLPYLSHFSFIALLYYSPVINNNFVIFFIFLNSLVFPVTNSLVFPVKYPITSCFAYFPNISMK